MQHLLQWPQLPQVGAHNRTREPHAQLGAGSTASRFSGSSSRTSRSWEPRERHSWERPLRKPEQPAAVQAGAAAALQAASQLDGPVPLSQPQAAAGFVQQVLQPQSFRPNMRSKSSKSEALAAQAYADY